MAFKIHMPGVQEPFTTCDILTLMYNQEELYFVHTDFTKQKLNNPCCNADLLSTIVSITASATIS